ARALVLLWFADRTGCASDDAGKSSVECGLGSVAEFGGERADGDAFLSESGSGNVHPPASEIRDWCFADESGEASAERGSGHGCEPRESVEIPFVSGAVVDRFECAADSFVVEGAEPSGDCLGSGCEPAADRLHNEDVGQAGGDGFDAEAGGGQV